MAKSVIAVLREVIGRDFTEDDLIDFAQLTKKTQQMDPHQIKKYNKNIKAFLAGELTEDKFMHRARVLTGMNKIEIEKVVSNLRVNPIHPF